MKSFIQTYCSNNHILQEMDPTSYYHPTAVPILWLYFDEAADHCAHLRRSLPSSMFLIAAVRLESDHGWDRDIIALLARVHPSASSPHTERLHDPV